jgi:hypothetical protein
MPHDIDASGLLSRLTANDAAFDDEQQPHLSRLTSGRCQRASMNRAVDLAALPIIEPGRLWLIELSATEADLSPFGHRALASADVVIYDPALAPIVANVLPFGAYGEPVSGEKMPAQGLSPRALRFALDGWSVAQLLEHRIPFPARHERIRKVAAQLLDAGIAANLPVLALTETSGGAHREADMRLATLGAAVGGLGEGARLTLVFGPIRTQSPPHFHNFMSNGLAG